MDVPVSTAVRRQRQRRRWGLALGAALVLVLITVGLSRLQPALPRVENVYLGTVQRGDLILKVRGNGTLVPEQIQFVQAETEGRVERILAQPGAAVSAETVLMELSNPELEQTAFDAEWQLKGAEAQFTRLRAQLEDARLLQRSAITTLKAEAAQAELEARANEALAAERLASALETQRLRGRADALREGLQIEEERFKNSEQSTRAQLAVQEAEVERARALLARKRQQVAALRVRAGVPGVLQQIGDAVPLQVGQRVTPGATLAKIVEPTRLKAVLRIPETQVKDVQLELPAEIDTRNGVIPGVVARIDPAAQNGTVTVEVKLTGPLPGGARPDLSVDGTIELARLESVLRLGRPVHAQADGTIGLFKVEAGGKSAARTRVKIGRISVNEVEVVEGLREGDRVVLSDMSAWDGHERVRVE